MTKYCSISKMVIFLLIALLTQNAAQTYLNKDFEKINKKSNGSNAGIAAGALMAGQWNSIGPNGIVATAVAVDPADCNKIFIGSIAGLFVSTNGGTNWSIVNSSFHNMYIYSLEMYPADHNIIIASAGNIFSDSAYIYRSTDNGSTWENVQSMHRLNCGKIVFAKSNPDIVYVEGYYLYKSTDAGATWVQLATLSDINTFDVYKGDSNKLYLQLNNGKFYKSDDGGATYTLVNTLSNTFSDIAINPANSLAVYGGTDERGSNGGYGFFTSTDGGVNWSSGKTGFGKFSKILFITFHPDYDNIVYTGGTGSSLLKSTDSGATWTDIMAAVSDNYTFGIRFDAQRNLYVNTAGNVYKSTDQSTWQPIASTLSNQDVFDMEINPSDLKTFYAATVAGVYKTIDGGANWVEINNGITDTDIFAIAMSPLDYNTLFVGTYGGLVYRTTDGGNSWVEKTTGLPGLSGDVIHEIWCHPQTAGTVFVLEDDNGIFCSNDNGESWSEYKIGSSSVYSLKISATSKNVWYAKASYGKIYYSNDYGITWTYKGEVDELSNLTIDSGNPNTLYGNQYSFNFVRSTDQGATWTTQYSNLYFYSLLSTPTSPYALYGATLDDPWVVTSADGGTTWTGIITGPEAFRCLEIINLPGYSNYFFVTTYGGSIYGYNYTPTGVEKDNNSLPSDYYLAQNYPNPFNPSTTISFSIPKTGNVSLKVFDMLGREVADLVNENMAAGNYKVNFNAQNLASGVYIYSLRSGNVLKTSKMNLTK